MAGARSQPCGSCARDRGAGHRDPQRDTIRLSRQLSPLMRPPRPPRPRREGPARGDASQPDWRMPSRTAGRGPDRSARGSPRHVRSCAFGWCRCRAREPGPGAARRRSTRAGQLGMHMHVPRPVGRRAASLTRDGLDGCRCRLPAGRHLGPVSGSGSACVAVGGSGGWAGGWWSRPWYRGALAIVHRWFAVDPMQCEHDFSFQDADCVARCSVSLLWTAAGGYALRYSCA